jgi:hypothetical protein
LRHQHQRGALHPSGSLPDATTLDLCSPTLPTGKLEIEWLLPDRVTHVTLGMSNGTKVNFVPGFNVYIARLPLNPRTPVPRTIDWTDAHGQPHSVTTSIPPGAQHQTCAHPNAEPTPTAPRATPAATIATVTSGSTATVVNP